jgi:hypothetical protein
MKYQIMHDYGSEGFAFYKEGEERIPTEYDSVGEALSSAMESGYGTRFIIVNVIDPKNLTEKLTTKP